MTAPTPRAAHTGHRNKTRKSAARPHNVTKSANNTPSTSHPAPSEGQFLPAFAGPGRKVHGISEKPLPIPEPEFYDEARGAPVYKMEELDPFPRLKHRGDAIIAMLTPIHDAHNISPGITKACDYISGLVTRLAFIHRPQMPSHIWASVMSRVWSLYESISRRATHLMELGDDRLLAIVLCYLLQALFVIDPVGRPPPKHHAEHDSHVVLRRVKEFEAHGDAALLPLLQEYRELAYHHSVARTKLREGTTDKLKQARSLLEKGRTLNKALKQLDQTPPDLSGVGEFEAQAKRGVPTKDCTDGLPQPTNVKPFKLPTKKGESTNGHNREAVKRAIIGVLRGLNKEAAAYVDGLSNKLAQVALRDPDGWIVFARHAEALEPGKLKELNERYRKLGLDDCESSILNALLRCVRGRAIPKPKKLHENRSLELSGVALSIRCGFIVKLNKDRIMSAYGTYQLCGTSSGADVLVHFNQVLADTSPVTHLRWGLDIIEGTVSEYGVCTHTHNCP